MKQPSQRRTLPSVAVKAVLPHLQRGGGGRRALQKLCRKTSDMRFNGMVVGEFRTDQDEQ